MFIFKLRSIETRHCQHVEIVRHKLKRALLFLVQPSALIIDIFEELREFRFNAPKVPARAVNCPAEGPLHFDGYLRFKLGDLRADGFLAHMHGSSGMLKSGRFDDWVTTANIDDTSRHETKGNVGKPCTISFCIVVVTSSSICIR